MKQRIVTTLLIVALATTWACTKSPEERIKDLSIEYSKSMEEVQKDIKTISSGKEGVQRIKVAMEATMKYHKGLQAISKENPDLKGDTFKPETIEALQKGQMAAQSFGGLLLGLSMKFMNDPDFKKGIEELDMKKFNKELTEDM